MIRLNKETKDQLLDLYKNIHSIQFFNSLVAYKIDKKLAFTPSSIWNHKNTSRPSDFRYEGTASAKVLWPNAFTNEFLVVKGGKSD